MKLILATATAITIVSSTMFFVLYKLYRKNRKLYEEEHLQLLQLQEEYSKLAEAYKIKKENKEKADEEISNLHNGTMSADDVLPKRKGRS